MAVNPLCAAPCHGITRFLSLLSTPRTYTQPHVSFCLLIERSPNDVKMKNWRSLERKIGNIIAEYMYESLSTEIYKSIVQNFPYTANNTTCFMF